MPSTPSLWGTKSSEVVTQMVKNPLAMWETWVRSLVWEDPLEKGTATYSSILSWRNTRTVEPGGPQSMGSQISISQYPGGEETVSNSSEWASQQSFYPVIIL